MSNYNALLEEDLSLAHDKGIILSDSSGKAVDVARDKLNAFIREHESKDLRITLIRPNGKVVYDNMRNDFDHFSNHINRKEIQEALRTGLGSSVERQSKTLKHDYFYVATYFPADSIIIRSALPYNNDLSKSLKADHLVCHLCYHTPYHCALSVYASLGKECGQVAHLRL